MINLIIGIVLIVIGVWGISTYWLMFLDVVKMIFLLGLISFGLVAILAGIRRMSKEKR